MPSQYCQANAVSAINNASFVDESITKLLADTSIVEVDVKPFICSPLSVVENSTKKRLVINLRHLNNSSGPKALNTNSYANV